MGCQKQHLSNGGPSFSISLTVIRQALQEIAASALCQATVTFNMEDMQFIQMHLFCIGFPQENKESFNFQLLLAGF